ncbi:PREDICTED: WD repeat-containing protein 60 [Nicrophorus vespilloides]|uniref:WD repeat-containing protein 60 n=1 Tax=Nicrophorus vespilloides TaxID=110193 RepID=A0ABM1N925_NICVS|nr:PREDICTED: WD repeat-containing protein 60 [Nicrophorus vespilloides]
MSTRKQNVVKKLKKPEEKESTNERDKTKKDEKLKPKLASQSPKDPKPKVKPSSHTSRTELKPKPSKVDVKSKQSNVDVKPKPSKTATAVKVKPSPKTTRTETTAKPAIKRKTTRSPLNSSRVVKSKFFPTKSMYASALQSRASSPIPRSPERPRTATLRKGSIVNMNIAGPDIPKAQAHAEPEDDYEDDFDSYNSDFEDYESSSSASSLPSQVETESSDSEDQPTTKSQVVEDEKKLDSGNFDLPEESKHKPMLDDILETKTNPASLSDEGFEETKSLQFINFLDARRKQQKQKAERRRSRRGEELMSMIRLDHQNFTLFEIAPISYDTFIKSFGGKNNVQASSQTGDDWIDEQVQTDYIGNSNKWTQFPNKFAQFENLSKFKEEIKGSGSDEITAGEVNVIYNEFRLSKFLRQRVPDVLDLLRKKEKPPEVSENLGFSDGFRKLYFSFSEGRQVNCLEFSEDGKLLTVYGCRSDDLRSIGCIWESDEPVEVFAEYGSVSCVTFAKENSKVIFAGSEDGAIAVWDLSQVHRIEHCLPSDDDDARVVMQLPNFTLPACTMNCNRVNAIKTYRNEGSQQEFASSAQVAALYENGFLMILGVIYKPNIGISLVKNVSLSLTMQINMQCISMVAFSNQIYIATNQGQILHSTSAGVKKSFSIGSISEVTCLDLHPYCSDYFLAGFSNGCISIFFKLKRRPLMTLQDDEDMEIRQIQWSHNKPCSFYVLCNRDLITVWDLAISDLVPIQTTAYGIPIRSMKIHKSSMAVATVDGPLKLHTLKEDRTRFDEELKMFKNYLRRL